MAIQLELSVIGVFLVAGCNQEEPIESLSTPLILPATSIALLPTDTPIHPTETPTITVTELPTSTPTEQAEISKTPRPTITSKPTPDLIEIGNIGGGMIAFTSNRDGDNEIYILAFPGVLGDSMVVIQLTHNEADDVVSEWSPDGEKLAFMEIYLIDVETALQNLGGGEVQRITNHESDDMLPSWSPDGTEIAFMKAMICYLPGRPMELKLHFHPTGMAIGKSM
jgi:dipeptidyl aminopeptidase/acylaminoacyl peptidase